jgi:hypothetical protein
MWYSFSSNSRENKRTHSIHDKNVANLLVQFRRLNAHSILRVGGKNELKSRLLRKCLNKERKLETEETKKFHNILKDFTCSVYVFNRVNAILV